jgi:hypothetical protein
MVVIPICVWALDKLGCGSARGNLRRAASEDVFGTVRRPAIRSATTTVTPSPARSCLPSGNVWPRIR